MIHQVVAALPAFAPLKATLDSPNHQQYSFFQQLSEQVGEWSVYNFGQQFSHRPGMGMIEELAELEEARLALKKDAIFDAVADVTIYMADYYSKRGWNMGTSWSSAIRPDWVLFGDINPVAFGLIRRLSHHHLKGEQGIRGGADKHAAAMREACEGTLWYLKTVSTAFGKDYIEVVAKVWSEVSKRDWQKNKNNAHEVATQQVIGEVLESEKE